MKKRDLGQSPSKKRRLKPWVKDIIEVSKTLGECIVRLSILVVVILGSTKIFDTPEAGLTSILNVDQVDQLVVTEVKEDTEENEPQETHEDKIARLVADVESGKAGNGDARKIYLGEDYDEVQSIINKKYPSEPKQTNSKKSTSKSVTKSATGSKAEYQAYAYDLVINVYGWSESDFNALVILWDRESNWNPNAHNKSSGAHGIPQSLPASKMASEGSDYMTSHQTQIRWGLKYIKQRYGNPSNALDHSNRKGWY